MSVQLADLTTRTHRCQGRSSTPSRATDRKELDSFIETLVGEKASAASSPAGRRSRPSSTFGAGGVGAETYERASSGSRPPAHYASAATQTFPTAPGQTTHDQAPGPTKAKVEIPTYSKAVQTSEPWSPQRQRRISGGLSDSERDQSPTPRSPRSKRLSRREREREEELRQNLRREIEEELKAVRDLSVDGTIPTGPSNFPARALTDEEANAVTASEDFLDFVERSSKVIEKALDQDYDVLADYALDGADGVDEDEDEGYGSSTGKKGRRIKQVAQFYDERWSKKRMISDMCFSPKVGSPHSGKRSRLTKCSFQSSSWHLTPRIRLRLKILQVCYKYGICICIHDLSTPSTAHLTF